MPSAAIYELGLDADELMQPCNEAGEGWKFLLDDLLAKAEPITSPRVKELLSEYDKLEAPFLAALKMHGPDG